MAQPDVTVIVLGWNGRQYLPDCLDSLLAQDAGGFTYDILYVDNGSADGSLEYVRANYPAVRTLALDRNHGYAEGNNIGVGASEGRAVVFLNQDTIVHRDCIATLARTLAEDDTIGACHANIMQPWYAEFDPPDTTAAPRAFYTADLSRLAYVRYRRLSPSQPLAETLFLHGVCIAIRRHTLDAMGYAFDPDFFAYAEDMDLALRVRTLGLRTVAVRDAVVFHKHTLKTDTSLRVARHTVRIIRNRALALWKVMSVAEFAVALPLTTIGAPFNVTEFGLSPRRRALYFMALVPAALAAAVTTLWQLRAYAEKRRRVLAARDPRAGSMLRALLRQPW